MEIRIDQEEAVLLMNLLKDYVANQETRVISDEKGMEEKGKNAITHINIKRGNGIWDKISEAINNQD